MEEKDNVLKKEFQKKDVERLRNLIKGKSGDKTNDSVGYKKYHKTHSEGEIWTEDGRTWTVKDGIKQNITKLDQAKKHAIPLFCSTCNKIMNKQLDTHYYKAYGFCLDCTTKHETHLKLEGKWEAFLNETHNKEIDKLIEDYKAFMKESIEESNNNFISEAGEVEKWVGGINKTRANETLEDGIKYLESLKK
jgi:hypothetical protein